MNRFSPVETTARSPRGATLELAFETEADPSRLEAVADFVERALDKLGVRDKTVRGHFCVSIDEAVTNVVMYAYPGNKGTVKIVFRKEADSIAVEITDHGRPFNPLQQPAPDTSASIEKRLIGGLGIHLMRHMMDSLSYRRQGDANCLTLSKKIGGSK